MWRIGEGRGESHIDRGSGRKRETRPDHNLHGPFRRGSHEQRRHIPPTRAQTQSPTRRPKTRASRVGGRDEACETWGEAASLCGITCVQEFQDAQEWKGRGGGGRSRASAASNGDGPSLSLEGAEGLQGADAEALAQRILSHQLQADQHSLLCPVTHTHVLWDEGVAAKMYRAAAKD